MNKFEKEPIFGWLYTIIRNILNNYRRMVKRKHNGQHRNFSLITLIMQPETEVKLTW